MARLVEVLGDRFYLLVFDVSPVLPETDGQLEASFPNISGITAFTDQTVEQVAAGATVFSSDCPRTVWELGGGGGVYVSASFAGSTVARPGARAGGGFQFAMD